MGMRAKKNVFIECNRSTRNDSIYWTCSTAYLFLHFCVTSKITTVLVVNQLASYRCKHILSSSCLKKRFLVWRRYWKRHLELPPRNYNWAKWMQQKFLRYESAHVLHWVYNTTGYLVKSLHSSDMQSCADLSHKGKKIMNVTVGWHRTP